MAIIYTYPEINQVEGEDLLLISDTSLHKRPTRSVTVNDLAAYIGTVVGVVQNLQSVLTVGNTYVSPDGYGTFTLNDITNNNGNIKYANTDEGWGYALNAEEGLYFTDGAGSSTGFTSINRNRISIGNDNYIGEISSSSITANRTYALPNASGTIALENLSEWYSVTGSRGLGNLVVKIGDYDGSGNGTFLTVDDSDESMFFTKGNLVESKFVFAATQDRDYTFPDADGTIALTSDIPAAGPGGSGTTNYTARWTNANTLGIGTLYDNGTNVGIGTTTPTQKLEVNGTVLLSTLPNNNGRLCLGSVSTNLFSNAASGHLYISTNGSTRMTVLNNGNVGIGTTSPEEKLNVIGSVLISNNEFYKVENTTGTNYKIAGLTNGNVIQIGAIDYTSAGTIFAGGDNVSITTGGASGSTRIKIASSGNVGIGTTSPSQKLQVAGNIYTTGSVRIETTGNQLEFGNANVALQRTSNLLEIGGYDGIVFKSSNTVLDSQAERMRITSAGNVGIGTTAPSEKLEVSGARSNLNGILIGENNSNIQFPGDGRLNVDNNDWLIISEGGVEVMRAGGAFQRLGIGTTNPGAKLEVNGNVVINSTGLTEGFQWFNDTNEIFSLEDTAGSGELLLLSSNSVKVKLNANGSSYLNGGNVGIGTTSPLSKLNVNGDIKIEGENELYFGSSGSVPLWEIKASGSDLVINNTGTNVGSVLFNNDEGVVLPRLTTTEINAISLPNTGLTVYNTTLNTLCFYNGSSWQKVSHTNM